MCSLLKFWWDGWMASKLNGHEFQQTLGDSEGQESLPCCSPWGCRGRHDWATEQQKIYIFKCYKFPFINPFKIPLEIYIYLSKGTYIFIYSSVSGH